MTAEQIIETIRTKEHSYYLELKRTEQTYDFFATSTNMCRAKWDALYSLCRELGIEDI